MIRTGGAAAGGRGAPEPPGARAQVSGEGLGRSGDALVTAAVALGSNLGDREAHLRAGLRALGRLLRVERVSRVLETPPWGDPHQDPFLNLVALGRTALPPRKLLEDLLEMERSLGRVRTRPGGPRTLDADLILHGDAVLREPGLSVPHPRWHLRPFVALPLLELLPQGRDPETGLPLRERVSPDVFDAPRRDRGVLTGWEGEP